MTHPFTPHHDGSADNKSVILRFIDVINNEGKSAEVLEQFTSSPALKHKAAAYEARYPGFQLYPLDLVAERDLVAVRFIVGFETQAATNPSTPVVGRAEDTPPRVEAIAICRLAGGRVSEFWLESDVLGQAIAVGDTHHSSARRVDVLREGPEFMRGLAALNNERREENRSLIQRGLAALNNQGKTIGFIRRFASDPTLAGHIFTLESGFPGYSLWSDEIIAEGDKVAVRFHTKQHHTREYMGIPATGKEFSITGIILCRVEAGLIAETWLQADTWALTQELQEGPVMTRKRSGPWTPPATTPSP